MTSAIFPYYQGLDQIDYNSGTTGQFEINDHLLETYWKGLNKYQYLVSLFVPIFCWRQHFSILASANFPYNQSVEQIDYNSETTGQFEINDHLLESYWKGLN